MVQPTKLQSRGGIKRDGTILEGDYYIDGQWVRFQRGRPRKIGGYQSITSDVPEIARGMESFSADGVNFLHIGHPNSIGQYLISNAAGTLNSFNDRTPISGFNGDLSHLWQMDVFFDTVGAGSFLVAHPGENLANIDNSVASPIFIGDVTSPLPLVESTLPEVSGGIVAIGVFLFTYGENGEISYTPPNDLSSISVTANITQQKIIKGFPLRGAGTGPAGLFWSLDSLIRATFTGGTPDFAFDTLSTSISVLSSQAIVEYDGIFYWPGVDRWMMFNGVVREIPNELNQNFFFDNLNLTQRQKVFGVKVPRFGEIWWCFPFGDATECNHAIIYNIREQTWYDTALPDANGVDQGRTSGIFADVYNKPFMVDNFATDTGRTLWQHETTKDKVENTKITAIPSHFETSEISMITAQQAMDKSLRVARVEPDFVQTGDMTMVVKGRMNARAPVVTDDSVTFADVAATGTDETLKLKTIRRLMSFRFESNVQGGDYELGEPIAHIEPADGRVES